MALVQPPPHDPPSANEIPTDNAEQLVLLENPEKEWFHQLPPPRRKIYLISAKIALVLIFAIFYHTFCFIVHYRNVPIGNGVLSLSFLHFNTVSVITTVAILIVYVALWPMNGVIDEIRAEEFFRLMHTHPNGVPLDRVNAISATTTGAFDIFMATIYRHCSPLLTSTLFFSLLITATSSIAPAALSAGSIWIDVDNSTFLIGALPEDLFNNNGLQLAANMAWVENFLNLTNGYYKVTSSEGDQSEYIVPFPPGYTSTMKAYWTTDIVVLDPSCSWQTATATGPINSSWNVTLGNSNMVVFLTGNFLVSSPYNFNTTRVSADFLLYNTSSGFNVPVDGSVLFVIDQLDYPGAQAATTSPVDLSSIPTLKIPTGNVLAFLLCYPHISIKTRQVRATGNGNLTLEKPQRSQGNIDFNQANNLLSNALAELPISSGPTSHLWQVGTDLMVRLIFGNGTDNPFDIAEPAPLNNITAMYKQVIQSVMKTFLSGAIATVNVPGGYTEEQMVFTSSLGHVITSAIFFAFLIIALVAAQFRKGRVPFTFANVAAALADSDVPQKCVKMTQFEAGTRAGTRERKVLKLVPSGDGQLNCAYQSIDED